jgi:hypothetical protein
LELQHKDLAVHLSKLSSIYATVTELHENALTRDKRVVSLKETQTELETRANTLLRKLLTINQPQTSEAEDKWFKELMRVKSRLSGQRGMIAEVKLRITEGKKFVELAGKRVEGEDEPEKKKLDGRVMEAIEEAYDNVFDNAYNKVKKGGEAENEDCKVKFCLLMHWHETISLRFV